ncbi:hypothetical protein [Ligilactobacillus ruminis]
MVFENHNNISLETEALLMFADRKEHLKTIQKMLNDGYDVVCDRYR